MKFGTHNLHDYTGQPTSFADIIVFTEAIPSRVKSALEPQGYVVVVCRKQKDLCIAYRKGVFKRTGLARYKRIHGGVAKVTPNRGTFWITGTLNGKPCAVIAEHRINAAFPPYIRGEGTFRRKCWEAHTEFTNALARRLKGSGKIVLAAGDVNTPEGVSGYGGSLTERGTGFDRAGVSGVKATGWRHLSRVGSDHLRLVLDISL